MKVVVRVFEVGGIYRGVVERKLHHNKYDDSDYVKINGYGVHVSPAPTAPGLIVKVWDTYGLPPHFISKIKDLKMDPKHRPIELYGR
jgi:hypothetical protein